MPVEVSAAPGFYLVMVQKGTSTPEPTGGSGVLVPDFEPWREIIGVVANPGYTALGETPQPCVYLPLRQNFRDGMILYVQSEGDPGGSLAAVQKEIHDPRAERSRR